MGSPKDKGFRQMPLWDESLQRNIPVFLWWVFIPFVLEHLQRLDQALPRLTRMDDSIHEPAFRSHVGIREAVPEFFHFLRSHGFAVFRSLQFALVDDVDGTLGPHNSDLRRGPGIVHVRSDMLL